MSSDITFGELEESRPDYSLRPDLNKQFVVVDYEEPIEGELPIFVALDVMRDMEEHALTDTDVELGGVMLGGQFEDEDGNAFVVVSDSLRAEHYEATKGSFKFTHETWSQITREREDFPDDLQMVGWYHTHPDWGVFLSGMDMFICDNFFNKPLDIALVIDPCRDDRGMFQWTGDPSQRVRRVGGFSIFASRFRSNELQQFVGWLEGNYDMARDRFSTAPMSGNSQPPVVNLTQMQSSWQGIAVMGMLTMQFLMLALIAWKLLFPLGTTEEETKKAERIAQLAKDIERIEEREATEIENKATLAVLDNVVAQLGDGDVDFATTLAQQKQENFTHQQASLAHAQAFKANTDTIGKLEKDVKSVKTKLAARDASIKLRDATIREIKEEKRDIVKEKEGLEKEIKELESGGRKWYRNPKNLYLALGAIALFVCGGAGGAFLFRRDDYDEDDDLENDRDSPGKRVDVRISGERASQDDEEMRMNIKETKPPANNPSDSEGDSNPSA